jgi:AraC family transcriptional regulator
MLQPIDILTMAHPQPALQGQWQLLHEKEQQMPGSVHYVVRRYYRPPQSNTDDMGMLVYHYNEAAPAENCLELRFCVTGNAYCKEKDIECNYCLSHETRRCQEKIETVDVFHFRFSPAHLSQFVKGKVEKDKTEQVLNFTHRSSFSKAIPLCGRTRSVLESMLTHSYSGSLENIYLNSQTQILLLYSLECMLGEKEAFTCKFLANEADREKIIMAREVLLQHIGEPITIKELSRKVAINECYLKKGFKELFGSTIFDFYQSQRMEHAKYLLYEKGLSVTEVSMLLGYSSISHFSTAFKKHTGLKPCELLLH